MHLNFTVPLLKKDDVRALSKKHSQKLRKDLTRCIYDDDDNNNNNNNNNNNRIYKQIIP
jgi:hypothetical protein